MDMAFSVSTEVWTTNAEPFDNQRSNSHNSNNKSKQVNTFHLLSNIESKIKVC